MPKIEIEFGPNMDKIRIRYYIRDKVVVITAPDTYEASKFVKDLIDGFVEISLEDNPN